MHAARHGALGRMHTEELVNLAQNALEGAGFVARGGFDRIAVHRITGPDHIGALLRDRFDKARQMIAHGTGTKARDQRQTARFVLRVQLGHQLFQIIGLHGGAAFQPDRVLHTSGEFHMCAIGLARAVPDPEHMARARQPFAGFGLLAAQRLFVFQQQGFVAGVELNRLQRMRCVRVHARRRHEIKRVGDARGQVAVFLSLFAIGKAQCPAMHLVDIRIPTGREGAQQIQRSGSLGVRTQHVVGVGDARFCGKRQIIDDVTAVAGQLNPIHNFQIGRTRFGKLARHAAHFDHRNLGAIGQHHGHLQHHLEGVADHVAAELLKAFCAVATLQQKRLATPCCGQMLAQSARLSCKNQNRIARQLRFDGAQGFLIGIGGHLDPWQVAPA